MTSQIVALLIIFAAAANADVIATSGSYDVTTIGGTNATMTSQSGAPVNSSVKFFIMALIALTIAVTLTSTVLIALLQRSRRPTKFIKMKQRRHGDEGQDGDDVTPTQSIVVVQEEN